MGTLDSRSDHVPSTRAAQHIVPCPKPHSVRRIVSCPAPTRDSISSSHRRVSFSSEVETRDVTRRCDFPEEEFAAVWYCKDDYKEMKKEYTPTLKKMAKNLPLDEGEESRGLEHKTPRGNKKRHQNRFASIDAVLGEQDRQWERNRRDPEFLAQMYIQSSAHCGLEASLIAKKDAEYIERCIRNTDEDSQNSVAAEEADPSAEESQNEKPSVTVSPRRTHNYTVSNGFRASQVLSAAA